MTPLNISHYTVTSALGRGRDAHGQALQAGRSGLRRQPFETCALDCWTGQVDGLDTPLTGAWAEWDCRNNRLAELGLQQDGFLDAVAALRRRLGGTRIGVFMGTSTSGVHQTELAYCERQAGGHESLPDWFRHRQTQCTDSIAEFVRRRLDLNGPGQAISTACSSSAKVFAAAHRAIAAGFCDAAVVGGVDSLCLTTLYGFNALQLLSDDVCRPADAHRRGLSIGEAAGFALLQPLGPGPWLLGYGESSDAHHMSAPDPDGRGAITSMQGALQRAGLGAGDVDYINLHGTGTPANDLAEDRAVCTLFGRDTPCSSTKGWTGHTLGAAGIVEAAIALQCLASEWLPHSLHTRELDPKLQGAIVMQSRAAPLRRVMSNSFGFGGSNCSLLFGAAS